jgi:hypothetical protein
VEAALAAITAAVSTLCGDSWDCTFLAVATPQSTTPNLEMTAEEWEAICSDHGFEYIDSEAKGRNTFGGEYNSFSYAVSKPVVEFVGVKRLREALETTDWETDDTLGFDELDGTEDDPESGSPAEFDIELTEMNRELLQLKTSLGDGSDVEDDDDVQESKLENLTSMMASLQAIRGTMFP